MEEIIKICDVGLELCSYCGRDIGIKNNIEYFRQIEEVQCVILTCHNCNKEKKLIIEKVQGLDWEKRLDLQYIKYEVRDSQKIRHNLWCTSCGFDDYPDCMGYCNNQVDESDIEFECINIC